MTQEPTPTAVPFTFDADAYTLDELEQIEELGRTTVQEVAATGRLTIRFVRAVAFVTMRRRQPHLTFEELARWNVNQLTEAMAEIGHPPARAAGETRGG